MIVPIIQYSAESLFTFVNVVQVKFKFNVAATYHAGQQPLRVQPLGKGSSTWV